MLNEGTNDKSLISKEMLEEARQRVKESPLQIIRTPLINIKETTLSLETKCNLFLKLENMQNTGSFKIRGVASQFARAQLGPLITMSAGNYGRSFAYAVKLYGYEGRVLMPNTAPASRASIISSYGVDVEMLPSECLKTAVDRYVTDHGMTFLHPFDDIDLIGGYGSLAFEILEEVPEPDVIVVSCGGGGLLSGIASAVKLSAPSTKVYGVEPEGERERFRYSQLRHWVSHPEVREAGTAEPSDITSFMLNPPEKGISSALYRLLDRDHPSERFKYMTAWDNDMGQRISDTSWYHIWRRIAQLSTNTNFREIAACTMFRSFLDGKPASMDAKSIAAGLAPPFAGTNTFNICREHVEAVILVSDDDIVAGTSLLYRAGLVVEPSGAAAFAAVLKNKIPNISGKMVVVVLSGGNISPEDLSCMIK